MRKRKYSVAEIDKMRCSLNMIYQYGSPPIEDMLRTYMLNGTEPQELEEIAGREMVRRGGERIKLIGSMAFDLSPGAMNRVDPDLLRT